eukprot:Blabericola_migrator_1__11956@NODE_731_length_6696_cov_64_725298_g527_i0_p3_GENE_NODE_731_length_6696_cov_64_725298_g527_i0NODE_731_length_6696_cov_64_725298_g527_i0_p3_ORF_typecomplete_len241_score30_44PBP1_TM/PF14812_6/1_1PBP1_TM/PF14812_6/6_3e03_NODE_731_length_6696_cov_64_725298_g527_i045945316
MRIQEEGAIADSKNSILHREAALDTIIEELKVRESRPDKFKDYKIPRKRGHKIPQGDINDYNRERRHERGRRRRRHHYESDYEDESEEDESYSDMDETSHHSSRKRRRSRCSKCSEHRPPTVVYNIYAPNSPPMKQGRYMNTLSRCTTASCYTPEHFLPYATGAPGVECSPLMGHKQKRAQDGSRNAEIATGYVTEEVDLESAMLDDDDCLITQVARPVTPATRRARKNGLTPGEMIELD